MTLEIRIVLVLGSWAHLSAYPCRVSTWQEECELPSAAKVCHGRLFLPLSAEFEVTQNPGDFWMALLYVRHVLDTFVEAVSVCLCMLTSVF